ncbi:uncharacterized protein LOC116241027 [Phasianus colchicus]|uniref:Uncharacterized protein n=1 Tax=Phasianus colchicus TaxID=9054 RepID=A0A669QI33_PHACC|nr:uncharacterized protein LOC116241027 [Phasianus colchicus]
MGQRGTLLGNRLNLWGRAPLYGSEVHSMGLSSILWGRGADLQGRARFYGAEGPIYGAELHSMGQRGWSMGQSSNLRGRKADLCGRAAFYGAVGLIYGAELHSMGQWGRSMGQSCILWGNGAINRTELCSMGQRGDLWGRAVFYRAAGPIYGANLWGRAPFYKAAGTIYGAELCSMGQSSILWGSGANLWGRAPFCGAEGLIYGAELRSMGQRGRSMGQRGRCMGRGSVPWGSVADGGRPTGDMAALLRSGLSAGRAVLLNAVAALPALIGVGAGLAIGTDAEALRWVCGAAAGIFLYVALCDMMPALLQERSARPWLLLGLHCLGLISGWAALAGLALLEDSGAL